MTSVLFTLGRYVAEHVVPAERLRPRWRRPGSKWRKSDAPPKQPAKKKAKAAPAAAGAPKATKPPKAPKASKAPKTAAASKPLRDGELLEVEVEVSELP